MAEEIKVNRFRIIGFTLLVAIPLAILYPLYYSFFSQTTPSHVYQITEDIIAELELFQKAAQVESAPVNFNPENLRPRHVMGKAIDTLKRLEKFKTDKGIEVTEIPEIKVIRVTPANVISVVKVLLAEVRALRATYGVEQIPVGADLEKNKIPVEIYRNLLLIDRMLDSLGVRRKTPRDVFQIVQAINSNLLVILQIQRKECQIPDRAFTEEAGMEEETPGDVYILANSLEQKMSTIVKLVGIDGFDTLVPSIRATGDITPQNVYDTMGLILADVMALKAYFSITQPTVFTSVTERKVPSDVFQGVLITLALTECIS